MLSWATNTRTNLLIKFANSRKTRNPILSIKTGPMVLLTESALFVD